MKKKMNPWIIVAIVAAVLAVCAVAVLLVVRYARNNIMDGPGMVNEHLAITSVNYSCGGDMNGNSYWVSAEVDPETQKIKISRSQSEAWNKPSLSEEYLVDNQVLMDEIGMILEDSELIKMNGKPLSDYVVDDGETISFSMIYNHGDRFYVSAQIVPEEYGTTMNQVVDKILEARQNENTGLTMTGLEGEDYQTEEGELKAHLLTFEHGYLKMVLVNNTQEQADADFKIKLFKKNGEEYEELDDGQSDKMETGCSPVDRTLYALDRTYILRDLNLYGKLEPGAYKITNTFGEFEVELK